MRQQVHKNSGPVRLKFMPMQKRVLTIIPDSSERYLSKGIYSKWG